MPRVEPKTVNNQLGVLSRCRGTRARTTSSTGGKLRCHVGGASAEIVAVRTADVAKLLAAVTDKPVSG